MGSDIKGMKSKAGLQKALPKTAEENPNFLDLTMELFNLEDEFMKAVGPLQKKLLKQSRKLYTESDKALKQLKKDKQADKYEVQRMLTIRKHAYDLGMMLKGAWLY